VSTPAVISSRDVLSVNRGDLRTVPGATLLVAMALAAIGAPLFARHDPIAIDLANQLAHPSAAHWLETDVQGRDVFARRPFGVRLSLAVGIGAEAVALLIGGTLGLVGGFYGYWPDELIVRVADVTLAFPTLLLLLAMVAVFQASLVPAFDLLGDAFRDATDPRQLTRRLARTTTPTSPSPTSPSPTSP